MASGWVVMKFRRKKLATILLLCRCLITTIHYNNFLQVFFILLFIYWQQNRIPCFLGGFKLYFVTASSIIWVNTLCKLFLVNLALNASLNRRLFYCFKYSWIDKIKIIDNQLSKDGTGNAMMCLSFQPIAKKMHFLLFLHMQN